MSKKHRNETEEERKERKRAKKEAKKAKIREEEEKDDSSSNSEAKSTAANGDPITIPTAAESPTPSIIIINESPFIQKRLKMIVSLYPVALGDAMSSIRQTLRAMLLKYSDGLGGILLGFDRVKFTQGTKGGKIVNELPAIHYNIQFDALLFCPEVGTKLTGVVNECFPSHVGMLVHCYFNAMVSSKHLVAAGYRFDSASQQWVDESIGNALSIEDKITFVTEKIHESDGIISMEGSHPTVG